MMRLKLQGRLTLGNTIMVVITVLVLSGLQLLFFQQSFSQVKYSSAELASHSLMRQLRMRAAYTADYLSDALVNPVYLYDMEGVFDLLAPALKHKELLEIRVFDHQGKVFHSGSEFVSDFGLPLNMPALERQVLGNRQHFSHIDDESLSIARPLFIGKELLGGLYLKYSLQSIKADIAQFHSLITTINRDSQRTIGLRTVLISVLLSLISVVVSIFLARTISRPILDLVGHSRRIGRGDYRQDNRIQRFDELGELAAAFNEMGSSLQERTDKISFLAYHDPLTQLPNRTRFIHHVNRMIDSDHPHSRQFAVIFIDLDDFKAVNDNLGHQAGDRLLCEVARRISANIRPSDFLAEALEHPQVVSRVGGDEFLLCVPGINQEQDASRVAERLLAALSQPVDIGPDMEPIFTDGSIGIALYPQAGNTAEALIKHADIAMYAAKADGKRTYCYFNDDMSRRIEHQALIERELRKAQSDMTQFELWYQPQIDLSTNTLIGAEALIRWRHPQRGLIPPNDFISIAENSGMIIPIGEWVIKSAARQLGHWQDLLPPRFHVAINLSAKQLYRQDVARLFSQQLAHYRLSPSRLHAEVTESLLMTDEKLARETLTALRAAGVQVWLDDFGTGYSSLGHLRDFQVDGLKIDRSFVADIEDDPHDRALCAAVISMAKDLGIQVVAEGIETASQSGFLAQKCCDVGQGYFYSRPLPADEFAAKYLTSTSLQHSAKPSGPGSCSNAGL